MANYLLGDESSIPVIKMVTLILCWKQKQERLVSTSYFISFFLFNKTFQGQCHVPLSGLQGRWFFGIPPNRAVPPWLWLLQQRSQTMTQRNETRQFTELSNCNFLATLRQIWIRVRGVGVISLSTTLRHIYRQQLLKNEQKKMEREGGGRWGRGGRYFITP